MGISIWQVLIIAVVMVLLFGRGKISALMGDLAEGIKSFKKGMADDEEKTSPRTIDHTPDAEVKADEVERRQKVG